MSNQPIALGGPGPIALGGPGPIALGPSDPDDNKPNKDKKEDDERDGSKKPKQDYTWADEVRINDETVITIPVEHILYGEPEKRKRKSRWGERPDLKKKVHQDVVFNPYQALTGGSHLLPITDGRDPSQILFGTTRDEDKPGEDQKRSTKWGPEWEKTFQPPMYNHIPKGMSIDDVEYLMRLQRLDDITRSLNGDLEIGDADIRSPSPDPVYDKNGVRVNTRVVRAKEKLLREKSDLIEECQKLRKNFVPPADYKPPKKSKKIFLPESEGGFDNQYIGRVIGPKGVTQKALESKTGCKISIRGKGSSKQKKTEYDSDEKLHVLIQAETDESVEAGAQEVEKILRGDVEETTEAQKAKQLQVAAISGALGDDYCTNCSEPGHKSYACPNRASITRVTIKCAICGDRSHPTSDCPNKKAQGAGLGMHHELASFMASLTGAKKPDQQQPMGAMGATNFMTNAPKPVLALTFGGTAMAYPQQPMFPGFGAPAPMMNPYAAVPQPQMQQMQPQPVRQQPPPNPAFTHSTTDSTITRPAAYSMPSNTGAQHFFNPMAMNYIPQNMQGAQASNITITNVNPTGPMGMPTMGTGQPGIPSNYIMPPGSTSGTANQPQTGTYQYSSAPYIRK